MATISLKIHTKIIEIIPMAKKGKIPLKKHLHNVGVYAYSEFLSKSEHATSVAQSQRRSFFSEFDHFLFLSFLVPFFFLLEIFLQFFFRDFFPEMFFSIIF